MPASTIGAVIIGGLVVAGFLALLFWVIFSTERDF